MSSDTPRRTLLERQVQTLRAMADVYNRGLAAMAEMNLDRIFLHTQELEAHCHDLALLNRQMPAAAALPGDADFERAVNVARLEVRRLNHIFRSVARRSARNVKTLLNIVAPANQYAPAPANGGFQTYV